MWINWLKCNTKRKKKLFKSLNLTQCHSAVTLRWTRVIWEQTEEKKRDQNRLHLSPPLRLSAGVSSHTAGQEGDTQRETTEIWTHTQKPNPRSEQHWQAFFSEINLHENSHESLHGNSSRQVIPHTLHICTDTWTLSWFLGRMRDSEREARRRRKNSANQTFLCHSVSL